VLVLGLGLLAHSPAAHAWLHEATCDATTAHHDHADSAPAPETDDHFCAVTAFAQGADSPAPAPLVVAPLAISVAAPLPGAKICPPRTEHLLPSGRAPPATA
jgi:hypothetical protein